MLKRRALRKMLITTITVFILLVVYLIPTKESEKELELEAKTNLEIEYITGMGTDTIYLLNEDNFLVKTNVLLMSDKLEEKVSQLVDNLTNHKNNKIPNHLHTLIPEDVKLEKVEINEEVVSIYFSEEFMKIPEEHEEKIIEALVYSILDLKGVNGLKIYVNDEPLLAFPQSKKKLPEVLTKKIGINKVYDLNNRNGINRVVIYYLEEYDGKNYFVPVTKYVNDSRDKIKIIVDNLTSEYIYEPNLMSFLNQDTKLLDFTLEDNLMILNFNDSIFTSESNILEEVVYSIAYSVFDNYDVSEVVFEVNDQEIVKKSLNSLE